MDRKRNSLKAVGDEQVEGLSENWIDRFVAATDNTTSPELFRKWAAIFAVGATLERKVWVRTYGSALYPNLYVILCAPPGVGKTEVIWRVRDLLVGLEEHHVAPTSVTKASLIDELNDCEKKIVKPERDPPVTTYNSLTLCVNELGNFLPDYENAMMNTLTDLYDCKQYGEKRRTSKLEIQIDHPQINMFAGCTPSYLNHFLPDGAWEQGFTSRALIIYTGEKVTKSLFSEQALDEGMTETLQDELSQIDNLFGQMAFTSDAAAMIDRWHLSGGDPKPDHPKLFHYTTRRTAHLLKLSMIACAVNSKEKVIRVEDISMALDWLIEAEMYMPEVFKAMSSGGAGKTMEEAWYYLYTLYLKEQKPILEHRLIQFLQDKTPIHQIAQTIEMMEKAQLIKKNLTTAGTAWIPQAKNPKIV